MTQGNTTTRFSCRQRPKQSFPSSSCFLVCRLSRCLCMLVVAKACIAPHALVVVSFLLILTKLPPSYTYKTKQTNLYHNDAYIWKPRSSRWECQQYGVVPHGVSEIARVCTNCAVPVLCCAVLCFGLLLCCPVSSITIQLL